MSPRTLPSNVLVTGANGSIGRLTCEQLIADGVGRLVMAGRSSARISAARDTLLESTGAAPERVVAADGFDMLNPDAVDAAVAALPVVPFDAVFLQAGGWVVADAAQTVTWNGQTIERTVFLNVLGAHATLRALGARGLLAPGCRVVIIGGEGARGVPGMIARPQIDSVDDLLDTVTGRKRGRYTPVDALGYAKLMAALWAQRLAALHGDHLTVVWFTPGLTGGTGGTQGLPAWKEWMFQRVGFPMMVWLGFAQWPEGAARKCADCVIGRIGEHGDLLGAPEGKAIGKITDQKPLHPAFTDVRLQEALWGLIEETVGGYQGISAA